MADKKKILRVLVVLLLLALAFFAGWLVGRGQSGNGAELVLDPAVQTEGKKPENTGMNPEQEQAKATPKPAPTKVPAPSQTPQPTKDPAVKPSATLPPAPYQPEDNDPPADSDAPTVTDPPSNPDTPSEPDAPSNPDAPVNPDPPSSGPTDKLEGDMGVEDSIFD